MELFHGLSSSQILYLLLLGGIVFTAVWLFQFKDRLKMNTVMVIVLSFLSMATGLFTVMLFARLESWGSPDGGRISLFGGVFFMPLFFWLGAKISKRSYADVFDIFSIPMIVAMLCGRMSCLLTGCCEGLPISGTNGWKWPTRELELLFYIVIILYYAPKVFKGKTKGEVYPAYMMTYGIFRFVIETFRVSHGTDSLFHLSHVWAVIAFCVGSSIYIDLRERRKKVR